jgi:UDP-N-acetylmuramoyl-tripeptide--D-alanyl-D-alanine ligase
MNLSIADLHAIIGGRLRMGDMPPREGDCAGVGTINTDSRLVQPGDVFWGLRGPQHDGSHFAEEALSRGAVGVVTSGRWAAPWAGRWSIEVDDSQAALWRLAAWNCNRFNGRLITIEGATAKTTASAMIAAVLNVRLVGEEIAGEVNNASQTAAKLVHLRGHEDYALIELHSQGSLPIDEVSRLARPDIAAFTHSGAQTMGDVSTTAIGDAVIHRLRTLIGTGTSLVINGDDAMLRRVAAGAANVVFVGRGLDAHIAATEVESANGRLRFKVDGHRFVVSAWGRHHLTTALIAIAVGRLFGASRSEIADGLAAYQLLERRCQVARTGDITIIDDTANREPAPTHVAMSLLNELGNHGSRVVICDIDTTRDIAADLPSALGHETVVRAGADFVVACGQHADAIARGARQAGLPPDCTTVCHAAEDAVPVVLSFVRPGDAVLIGSHRFTAVKHALVERYNSVHRRAA